MPLAIGTSLFILALAFLLAVARLVRGPSLPDRVVAVDLMTAFSIGIMTVTGIALNESALIQPALVLAFVSFLATVAFAFYVSRAARGSEAPE